MANIVSSSKEQFAQEVQVKYIPIAGNYKGVPLVCSTTSGEGKRVRVELPPNTWCKVPVEIAQDLRRQVKRSKRMKLVPDGDHIEKQMETDEHRQRMEMTEPDYDIIVKGEID